ncbi:MAG TPA: glutamate--cysteine ligase [Rubrobacteraceae bacterium]|nr:glutamate--cysteine ligase [Rubrobacteraceae bacterium]
METNFGISAHHTVGIEEEYQLVAPRTFALVPRIEAILEARDKAGLPEDSVASELSASCLEVRSPARSTVAELYGDLISLRQNVRVLVESRDARLLAAGAHPFSEATEQRITRGERYKRMEEKVGWPARMQAIYGLHVHVAVPDGEAAIRATNALSRHTPLFVALSANSPFWSGKDTRLASIRTKVFGLVPRSGLPPAFGSWADFEDYVGALVEAGSIPDYTWCWWDARPHPKLGTVELRAPDVQTEPSRTISLAALAQCLVARANAEGVAPEDPLFTEENKWRAARHGMDATFYDFTAGRSIAARDAARDLVSTLLPISQDLGCEGELEGILEIVEGASGADKQRAVLKERGSLEAVAANLVAATA